MLRIKNRYFLLMFAALSLFLASCSNLKRPAIGPNDVILVLADQTIFDTHKPRLEEVFGDPINTPMQEYRFNIRRIGMDEFREGSSKYKFLIFLVNVDSETAEAQFIKKMLSDKVTEGVRSGDYYYAQKNDVWSGGQTVLFLMDSKNLHLDKYLLTFKDKLYDIFNSTMIADVKERLFDKFNNKQASDYTKKNYNFEIFVPHDFVIIEEGKGSDKFIRYRRFNPDRWLTVLRTKYDTSLSFQENIIQTRDRIGAQFGDSVKVNPEFLKFQPDTTFVSDGVKARGIWEYLEGGGPFFTQAFLRNDTFYIIDGCVFAPEREKYPFIIQLELMAASIKFPELAR